MGTTDRARRAPTAERAAPVADDRAAPAAERASHVDLLALNRLLGNRAASELIDAAQTKLAVGGAGDAYEQEADAVARQVVASIRSGASVADPAPGGGLGARVQRRGGAAGGGPVDGGTEAAIRGSAGGRPMPPAVQAQMGSAFGEDFSAVRFHAGERASALNQALSAKAFTVGDDVFFRDGVPDTREQAGQELVAHELTHTLQQRGGTGAGVVQRLYVETDDHPEGFVGPEGQQVGYRWVPGAKVEDHEVSPVKTGWVLRNLYRPKAKPPAPDPSKTTTTAKAPDSKASATEPDAPRPQPPALSGAERDKLEELQTKLRDWGSKYGSAVSSEVRDTRRDLALAVKGRLAGTNAKEPSALEAEVGKLATEFDAAAKRVEDAKAAKVKEAQDAAAAEKRSADIAETHKKAMAKAKSSYGALSSIWSSDETLLGLLELAEGGTLQAIAAGFPATAIKPLLELTADRGATLKGVLKHVASRDHVTALQGIAHLTPTQMLQLLADTGSALLLRLAPRIPDGAVLVALRRRSPDEAAFERSVNDLTGTGYDVAAAAPLAAAGGAPFGAQVDAHLVAQGLVGHNGVPIAWMDPHAIRGDRDPNEQQAVTDALAHYDAGTFDPVAYYDRGPHHNLVEHLPGAKYTVAYRERGMLQPDGVTLPGPRRMVEAPGGRVYYSWTHYGDGGKIPAFVRVR